MQLVTFAHYLCVESMSNEQDGALMEMDLHALRLLHRVVSDAHANWPGGCPEEQQSLQTMKMQLYAALMDHLLEQ